MKKQFIYTLLLATCMMLSISCDKDDDIIENEETAKVTQLLSVGNWAITQYKNDGVDRTTVFSDYVFQFDTGNVLRATQGTTAFTGSWSVTADDDRRTDLDLNIFFSTGTDLRTINDDWEIINYSDTRIEVGDDYGDVDEDVIVFEKQ